MGPSESLFIAQIIVLLLVGRLLGEAMQRIGQPAVMGQLLAGVLLGPSVFGVVWPEAQRGLFPAAREQRAMLEAVSNLGILMLLLLTGMETDLKLVSNARRAAISVSTAGIALPFALGVTLGQFLPESMLPRPDQRLITSLFLGTALSVAGRASGRHDRRIAGDHDNRPSPRAQKSRSCLECDEHPLLDGCE